MSSSCLSNIESNSIVKHTIDPVISTTIGAIAAPLFTIHPVAGALFGLTHSLVQKGLDKISEGITNETARIVFIAISLFASIALAFAVPLLLSAKITIIGALALTFLTMGAKNHMIIPYLAFRSCMVKNPWN